MRSPGSSLIAMPKSRCGAVTSSISEVSGRRGEMRLALRRQAGQTLQDLAAALALRAQQRHVLAHIRVVAERALHLLGDQRDGGERRAELVRGGGGEAVERREMLLALQHQFGRGERVGEQARFLGDAEGVDGGEGDATTDTAIHMPAT